MTGARPTQPVRAKGTAWMVSIKNIGLIALPFVGLFALLSGGALALGVARMLGLAPEKIGALYGCSSFTNIGSIGALICFIFIGETGFAWYRFTRYLKNYPISPSDFPLLNTTAAPPPGKKNYQTA